MQVNTPAIIRGEQRSSRFRYRHIVKAAAEEVGVPASWIWYWLLVEKLKFVSWLRRVWVRLECVQELFTDIFAVGEAFYATGDRLCSPAAIQQVLDQWPGGDRSFLAEPVKAPAKSAVTTLGHRDEEAA